MWSPKQKKSPRPDAGAIASNARAVRYISNGWCFFHTRGRVISPEDPRHVDGFTNSASSTVETPTVEFLFEASSPEPVDEPSRRRAEEARRLGQASRAEYFLHMRLLKLHQ